MIGSRPDFISLFLVVGALAGNATLLELDIFLCLAVPAGLVLFLQDRTSAQRRARRSLTWWPVPALVVVILLSLRAQAIAVPYFELYWLWPVKALVLALFLLQQRGQTWPLANDLLLGGFALVLLLLSSVEEGRLYSIFGPNMLYRFFGASFLFSLIRAGYVCGIQRNVCFAILGVDLLGLVLTGSVGALGVIGGSLYLARDALARLLRSIWGLLAAAAAVAALFAAREFLLSRLFNRLETKVDRLDDDVRYATWTRILDSDPGLLGHDYRDLGFLWSQSMPYPHNAALELWAFYGALGAGVVAYAAWALLRSRKTRFYFFIPLLVIGIGAMFSGDLSDNFALLSLPILYLARPGMLSGRLALPPPPPAPPAPLALPAPQGIGR